MRPPALACAALRISALDGPLTRPPPAEGSYAEPPMAPLSRKAQLQQFSWQRMEELAFCSGRWPRLAGLPRALRSVGHDAMVCGPTAQQVDGSSRRRRSG